MTTQQTSVSAIDWTVIKDGKTKPLYRPLTLSPELAKEREAWLAHEKVGTGMRNALDAKIKAALAKTPFGAAVPEGYDLVVVHQYGPAFTAMPRREKGAKVNAIKVA